MVAHDVVALGRLARLARAAGRVGRAALLALLRLGDEAIHLPAVDVGGGVRRTVRAAEVLVRGVVEWGDAAAVRRIGHAYAMWDPIGTGICAEVGVKRPVLLHDDDHVLDFVTSGQHVDQERHRHRGGVATIGAEGGAQHAGATDVYCVDEAVGRM